MSYLHRRDQRDLIGTLVREETPASSHGSRTITIEDTETQPESTKEESSSDDNVIGILRLRGDANARRPPAIRWADSVIDNEGMNKKKSKICCIYHPPHAIDESSDSGSDSSSSSDSDSDDGHSHGHHNGTGDDANNDGFCRGHHPSRRRRSKKNPRDASPNAYERQPRLKGKQANPQ